MRYITALVLALSIGAAASFYAPSAQAAGVYVGGGLPAPVYGPPVAVGLPIAPRFYAGMPWYGPAYYGPRFWGYGHPYFGYRHGFAGWHRR